MFPSLRRFFARPARTTRAPAPWRPAVLALEDRLAPAAVSAITADFNNTAIPAGGSVWFNSAAKVNGLGGGRTTVWVTDQTITFTANGTPYSLNVPNTAVTFDPAVTAAATAFSGGSWAVAAAPPPLSGGLLGILSPLFTTNVFLSGLPMQFADGLPGGVQDVTWRGEFTADKPGVTVNWKWAAAAYPTFSGDLAALGVKATDANQSDAYHNSDKAGTPENFKPYLVAGATGNGGSNYTGSYSATRNVSPPVGTPPVSPPPAANCSSLAGLVYEDVNQSGGLDGDDIGLAGVTVLLQGTDDLGQAVSLTTTTADDGAYSFAGLRAGSYTISESQPDGYLDGQNTVGSQGGDLGFDAIEVTLSAGVDGVGNNFGEVRNMS